MRILLVNPPIEDFFFTPQRAYPQGTLSLATVLDQNGFKVRILNCLEEYKKQTLKFPKDFSYLKEYYHPNESPFCLFSNYYRFGIDDSEIVKVLRSFVPQIVGISANFTAYLNSSLELARSIKQVDKRTTVVIGGRAATALPEIFLNNLYVDFVIRGEAEFSFLELCQSLKNKKLTSIEGLCYRRPTNKLIISKSIALIKDLNSLPILNRRLINYREYKFQGNISASLYASRGCSMKCSFCAIKEPFRFRSADNVLREIEYCYLLGIRHFNFEDDNINLNPELERILDKLIQRFEGKIKISFMNGLLSLGLNKIKEKLIKAGLTHLDLSIASSSVALRKKMKRIENTKSIFSLADFMARNRIPTTVHFIIAYPKQVFKDAVRDIKLLASKKVILGASIFYPAIEADAFGSLNFGLGNYKSFRSSTACFDKYILRDRIFLIFYFSRIVNFIKELIGKFYIKQVSLNSLLTKQLGKLSHSNGQLSSDVKLDRITLGMLLLKKMIVEKSIYRLEEKRVQDGFIYRFIKEEFFNPDDVKLILTNLAVKGLNGGVIKI